MKPMPMAGVLAACLCAAQADPLKESTITQVVNRVEIITPSKAASAARNGGVFRAPNSLRTGPASRAELTAADNTITRVGANTVFRYGEEPRTIYLEQGNMLFYSPTGKGGGTIQTAGASAGVLGSTFMVSGTQSGGSKILSLQHRTRVDFKGFIRALRPGQLTFVLPGMRGKPPIFEFRLRDLVAQSDLINGFRGQLPSLPDIQANIAKQEREIAKGSKEATDQLIGDATEQGVELFDSNARQAFFAEAAQVDLGNPLDLDLILTSPEVPANFVFTSETEIASFYAEIGFDFASTFLNASSTQSSSSSSSYSSQNIIDAIVARNITFRTPTVNLSEFSQTQIVAFLARQNIFFDQSVQFLNFDNTLWINAGGDVGFGNGVTLFFGGNTLDAYAIGNVQGVGTTFDLPNGSLYLTSQGAGIDFSASSFGAAQDIFFSAEGGNLTVIDSSVNSQFASFSSAGTINLGGTTINASSVIVNSSATDTIDLNNTSIFASNIQMDSKGNVNILGFSVLDAISTSITAQETLSMIGPGNLEFLQCFGPMSISARTIVLDHVNFQGPINTNINLFSELGVAASSNPNTGGPIEVGKVNFVQGVQGNGVLVTGIGGGTTYSAGGINFIIAPR
jgi:hypothetical protein